MDYLYFDTHCILENLLHKIYAPIDAGDFDELFLGGKEIITSSSNYQQFFFILLIMILLKK